MNQQIIEPSPGYQALRDQAAWLDLDLLHCLIEVSGEEALDLLDKALPGKLSYLHPFRMVETPLLGQDLRIQDLLFVANLEDRYLVIGSRNARGSLLERLAPEGFRAVVEDRSAEMSLVGIEGPYAWRWAGRALGHDIQGLGVHSLMEVRGDAFGNAICVRNGYSGEYAYQVLCDRSRKDRVVDALRAEGGLPEASLEDLALAALETRMPLFGSTVQAGDCPLEQDLRYMIDFLKDDAPAIEGLKAKARAMDGGVVAFLADGPVAVGSPVTCGGRTVGWVRIASGSPRLGRPFGYAFLEGAHAIPAGSSVAGLLRCGETALTTCASPLLATRSLAVIKE